MDTPRFICYTYLHIHNAEEKITTCSNYFFMEIFFLIIHSEAGWHTRKYIVEPGSNEQKRSIVVLLFSVTAFNELALSLEKLQTFQALAPGPFTTTPDTQFWSLTNCGLLVR